MHFMDESHRTEAYDLLNKEVSIWDLIMFHMCLVPTDGTEDKSCYLVYLLVEANSD